MTNAVTALNIILFLFLFLLLNITHTLLYSDIGNILKNIYVSARGNKAYITHYTHDIKTAGWSTLF